MRKFLKKYWISIWLVIVLLACSSLVTYAAFTRINITKRVVSTDAGVGARFSSDSLNATSSGMTTRKSYSTQDSHPNVLVNIFNYPYPKASLYSNSSTTYSVTAKIGTHDGTDFTALSGTDLTGLSNKYSISYNDGTPIQFNTGADISFDDCTLAAGKSNPDQFKVYFDGSELGDTPPGYCVEIIATPEDTSLPTLKGYIAVRYSKALDFGWTGKLEELSNSKSYDGYNYIVEGNGKGKITFTWDPTYVTINKQFLQNPENKFFINDAEVSGSDSLTEDRIGIVNGMKELTLVVDSQKKSRYTIQFYKTNPSNSYLNSDMINYLPESNQWVEDN